MKRILIKDSVNKIGKEIFVKGWVDSLRHHGKVTFLDLRDRSGRIQSVIVGDLLKKAKKVSVESVIALKGEVTARSKSNINPDLVTGTVELQVKSMEVLNQCEDLPIPIQEHGRDIKENARLKYRYLDLRRSRLQKIIKLRSEVNSHISEYLLKRDFIQIDTPMLTKSTKEGARDFIVPSRLQPGKFYALPQSPQQYKQLLMTAGFENYYQFARCIRDEDLRADRGFEFTQLDLEQSFVEQNDIMELIENMMISLVEASGGQLKDQKFPVFTYEEAMEKFGADKFDLRNQEEKEANILAFAWVIDFPFFKKVDPEDRAEVADSKSDWTFTHNPFSNPKSEFIKDHLQQKNIGEILTTQYDLVCNGLEVGGGSIRAHDPEVLKSTFKIMGYSQTEIEESVGHMLKAFTLGTPPHGGIALGMDRLIALLSGEKSLKEVIAFPMTSSGKTAVMKAPSKVDPEHLEELSLEVIHEETGNVHDHIVNKLLRVGVNYQYMSHKKVFTSEEAAEVRGSNLSQAAKALVLQAGKDFILFVLPGDKRLNIKEFQKYLSNKDRYQNLSKVAMASKESVLTKTGLEVGSIPPFGSSMGLTTYVDKDLLDEEKIAFNAGRHDRSIIMNLDDYLKVEQPEVVNVN